MPRPRQLEDEKLLHRAMMVFWQQGYAATGIRALEEATGLKAPSLYHRFGSKEGLFDAALENYLETVIGWRVRVFLEGRESAQPGARDKREAFDRRDALAGLRRFLETTFDYDKPGAARLACLMINTTLEIGGQRAATDALIARGSQMLREGFARALTRLRDDGRLQKSADIAAHAEHLQLCLQGLLVSARMPLSKHEMQGKVELILATLPLKKH